MGFGCDVLGAGFFAVDSNEGGNTKVGAGSPVDVAQGVADERIVSRAAEDVIESKYGEDEVVAAARDDAVVSGAAEDRVVAVGAEDDFVAGTTAVCVRAQLIEIDNVLVVGE